MGTSIATIWIIPGKPAHYDRYQCPLLMKIITVMSQWVRQHLKSPETWSFAQLFVQAQIKKKHQSSASLAFVRGIHWRLVDSPHKGPVMRKMFPFDGVIISCSSSVILMLCYNLFITKHILKYVKLLAAQTPLFWYICFCCITKFHYHSWTTPYQDTSLVYW